MSKCCQEMIRKQSGSRIIEIVIASVYIYIRKSIDEKMLITIAKSDEIYRQIRSLMDM